MPAFPSSVTSGLPYLVPDSMVISRDCELPTGTFGIWLQLSSMTQPCRGPSFSPMAPTHMAHPSSGLGGWFPPPPTMPCPLTTTIPPSNACISPRTAFLGRLGTVPPQAPQVPGPPASSDQHWTRHGGVCPSSSMGTGRLDLAHDGCSASQTSR